MRSIGSRFATVLFALSLTAFVGLSGCATLADQTQLTFKESLAISYTTVTTVRQTATSLLDAKKLTAEDGSNVLQQTDNARAGLDIAKKMANSDLTSASSKLDAVRTILSSLQSYLASKQLGGR